MTTATRSTKSNEPATVDFRQTGDKSVTKSTVDFVADLSPILATVDRHCRQCVPGLFRRRRHNCVHVSCRHVKGINNAKHHFTPLCMSVAQGHRRSLPMLPIKTSCACDFPLVMYSKYISNFNRFRYITINRCTVPPYA